MTNLDSILRSRGHYFANKGPSSQSYGFSSSYVWMWELDHEEGRTLKNWCFWTVVLEKILELLRHREIKPVNLKANPPWIFIRRTDAEAEAPILSPPDVNSQLTGKDWCWERLRAGGEGVGGNKGWDGWMASLTQWTWVWANARKQCRTEKHGALQSIQLQRVRHDLVTEQQWTI